MYERVPTVFICQTIVLLGSAFCALYILFDY
jgi:hypothetical protein